MFFEKINKIDKLLARLIKEKEENQINKIDNTEMQNIIRNHYEQLYANKMDNLEEMDKYLEKYNLPKLSQKEIENLNRPITNMELKSVTKKTFEQAKACDQMASQMNSTKNLEKCKHLTYSNSTRKLQRKASSQTHSMRPP